MINVLIVDDHTVLRQTLQECLEAQDGLNVVGQAGDGDEALELAARLRPHVLLLDIEMPGTAAPVVVYRLSRVSPETAVVVLSMHDAPEHTGEMLRLGVRGFLHKSISIRQLVSTIREAAEPRSPVTLSVRQNQSSGDAESVLSRREREVLALAARALSNRQIAAHLEITEATVKRHLRNAYGKLGASSRLDAVNKAVAASLIRVAAHDRVHGPATPPRAVTPRARRVGEGHGRPGVPEPAHTDQPLASQQDAAV
jgi:DNA-binding NarL/FixJ family response regulator